MLRESASNGVNCDTKKTRLIVSESHKKCPQCTIGTYCPKSIETTTPACRDILKQSCLFIELKASGFLPILNYKLVWSIKLYENKEFLSKPNIIYSLFLVYQPV